MRSLCEALLTHRKQIGYPVLSVTETPDGIRVRQDRFLETGKGEGADNETLWSVHSLHVVKESADKRSAGMCP
jgi:hypothetical protein